MSTTHSGYLIISDITGYTLYLTQSELEHAQEVLKSLLELLIDHTKPPLKISRTAGDAVISYSLLGASLQGQTLVELVEDTYVAFRRAIDLMVLNNQCHCNACTNIANLDLKFFVHSGAFGIQRLGAGDELVGSDVNLIHRLLKNHVVEQTGIRAYALYTDAAIRQLGLQGFSDRLVAHRESYEHLGEVAVWIQDMQSAWQAKKESLRITIPPDRVAAQVAIEIDMPPQQVWDYLAQPEFRSTLLGSDRQEIVDRKGGRIAEGSGYRCYHGDQLILQTVLQWRPFEQMTTEDLVPLPGGLLRVLVDMRLEPMGEHTRLVMTFGKVQGSGFSRLMSKIGMKARAQQAQRDIERFKTVTESDMAAHHVEP